ncbi:calcium-binding protein, partial [Gallibacterium anatis]
ANQALEQAKEAAKKAIEQAPEAKREELNAKVDGLAPATVPEVTPIEPLAFDSESKTPAASAENGNKVILNLNGNATSDHTADTFDGNKATLIFGDATSPTEKVHTLTGAGNGRIKVYNPKLDWDMRTSDDGTGTQQDHAPGWGYDEEALQRDAAYNSYNPDDNRAYFYKWTGASDAADIILVENVQTDPDNGDTKVQGMIASEAKGAETKQVRFALDTLAGGNDYIKAKGVGGHVKIKTNEGDDVIELGYMNGRKGVGVPWYDGSNQIDMGEGNDKLLVTSQSADLGVYQLGYDNGSLYYTNAKIDMGEGNNEVSIYQNIIAGAEDGSGNYIRFGSGDDKLTVGGYIRSELSDTKHRSSNIIDLGGGHNTVQVKGGLYKDNNLKFLMVSDGSSEVTFGDSIGGYSSMLMGNGADTVVVNGNAEFGSDSYYDNWLNEVFAKNVEEGKANAMYQGFYETEFKQKVIERWASANIGQRIDLGNGENTLSITGSVSKLNYRGGVDSDTVTLGATSESRFWMGDGTNTLLLGSNSSSIGYSGGTGTDTITIKGNVNNNSTFNIGSGDNSITITGNAEQTWIGVSNNDQGFAQSGNDTVTIGGNFIGKGAKTEDINLGAGQDSVTISGKLQDSSIQMGDGNDSVTIRGIIDGSNIINAGSGDDVIVTNQIQSRNTHLIGGEGNDTFTVQYFRGDNQNAVSGGTGKDTLNITGNNNQFIVGWRSGWTNLWSIEEIVFKGTSGRNTIRIDEKSLTEDNNKSLYIKNQSTSSNTVDVNARYSSKSKQTLHEDRDSNGQDEAYSYTVYKFDGGYTLYIEDGINIK